MLSEMLRVERLSVVLELEEPELQPELQKMETKKNRQRLVSHGIKSEYLPVLSWEKWVLGKFTWCLMYFTRAFNELAV